MIRFSLRFFLLLPRDCSPEKAYISRDPRRSGDGGSGDGGSIVPESRLYRSIPPDNENSSSNVDEFSCGCSPV